MSTQTSAALAAQPYDVAAIRRRIVGLDARVPVLGGGERAYVNLDNAASTPVLAPVLDAVNEFLPWYSSIHRGAGYKSQLSTALYEAGRELVCRFVGADPERHVVVFGKNTTEAINSVAARIGQDCDAVVLSTMIEHHSNLLPWRCRTQLEYVNVDAEGHIDLDHLEAQLRRFGKRVRLVAVCGASNVTGCVPPIHEVARLAHHHGARVLVDAAQLVPHRAMRMGRPGEPDAIDFVAFSAHKMYAPFGIGVLVAPLDVFDEGAPVFVGGGTVDIVMEDEILWSEAPYRDEAGSPNVVGVVALSAAIRELERLGMKAVEAHERDLTAYALDRLATLPGLHLYGSASCAGEDRLGVLTFNIGHEPHGRVAAILTYEHAVAVRNGCFCAHPYLLHLLDMSLPEAQVCREQIRRRDYSSIPGAVRMSFGIYNTREDVDQGIDALMAVAEGRVRGRYHVEPSSGQYFPEGYAFEFSRHGWAQGLLGDGPPST